MDKVLAVGGIIFAAALLGSIAAWLMGHPAGQEIGATGKRNARRYGLATYIMVGMVAAGAVPLLLSLVRSNLVTDIFGASWAEIYENLVILFGLGLVAAYMSRFLVESSSRRIVDDLDTMRSQLKDAQAKNRALAEYVDDRAAERLAADTKANDKKLRAAAKDLSEAQRLYIQSLTAKDQNVLEGLAQRTYRTASGLAADLELPRFKVEEMLADMADAGLADTSESPVTHGQRYAITPLGWGALSPEHKAEPVASLV